MNPSIQFQFGISTSLDVGIGSSPDDPFTSRGRYILVVSNAGYSLKFEMPPSSTFKVKLGPLLLARITFNYVDILLLEDSVSLLFGYLHVQADLGTDGGGLKPPDCGWGATVSEVDSVWRDKWNYLPYNYQLQSPSQNRTARSLCRGSGHVGLLLVYHYYYALILIICH